MSALSRVGTVAIGLGLGLAVLAQALIGDTFLADVCYEAVLVLASAAAWLGALRWPAGRRLMPRLIAVGISLNALGELLFALLDGRGLLPDVSIADLAWFASYVCLCGAVWVVLTRSRGRRDSRADLGFVVDAVTIVVISVLIFWRFSVDPIVADDTIPPLVRAVWASYPVLDAVLLALVLRVLLSRSARADIDVWFAVGVCLWLAADILYLQSPDNQAAVTVMNAGWTVAPVLMARAAWRFRDVTPARPDRAATVSSWVGPLLVAVCPLLVPPALELGSELRGEEDRPLQLVIGMTLVLGLTFLRVARLIQSEQRAHLELEIARDEALAASDTKSMFLANMSHELRTPLTTVLATGELLSDTPLTDVQARLVAQMRRSGDRLLSMVDGVLDFSRIQAGQAVVERAELDLRALVTDVVEGHLPRAQRQGTLLAWEVDPRVPAVVVGDVTRIFQVLNNLIDNALKFIEGGRVHLDVGPVGEDHDSRSRGVQLSVADTGIGIQEKDHASVFESFTQVDSSATRRYQGAGLGLAICRELTELMGGSISIESEPGVGSTFTVRLPLLPPVPLPRPSHQGPAVELSRR